MAAPAGAAPIPLREPRRGRIAEAAAQLRPVWSRAAGLRALRATLVIPALFALTSEVLGNVQMATFAAFGGFATLVMVEFGGNRRDKLVAHLVMALAGSVLLVIGTAVSSTAAVAAAVTLPVVFCVLFAGITGPNAASASTALLLLYVLPAASPGTLEMIPARLAGWWLASVAGTVAVLVLAPRPAGDRLRSAAAASATALADQLRAALGGSLTAAHTKAAVAAKHALMTAFTSAPYRPTGLAVTDQALANLIEDLEWCAVLIDDTVREGTDLTAIAAIDQRLLGEAAGVLRDTARVLEGAGARPRLDELEESARDASIAALSHGDSPTESAAHVSFHSRMVAAAARTAATDALIAARRVGPGVVGAERVRWHGSVDAPPEPAGRSAFVDAARRLVSGNASLRSVWLLNCARGALALAAAVAIADLTNVQHGFWVVLGALSVLRTSAASTGATALRAIGGTVLGFFIGAGLILAIGTNTAALWAALPLAILVASYTPGTAPFAIGQAAFTVNLSVLYNILVPIGWKVGVVRVEDVAIGAAVSAVVGVLFWPRGATSVVGDDLAEAFHHGGIYLVQATAWALGLRASRPDAGASVVRAGVRLDDGLRALLTEQGTRRVPKEQLWRLVGGAMRLRLTAQSLAGMPRPDAPPEPTSRALVEEAIRLAGLYDDLASRLGRTPPTVARELAGLPEAPSLAGNHGRALWVSQHLDHVRANLIDLVEPAALVAERRALAWWR